MKIFVIIVLILLFASNVFILVEYFKEIKKHETKQTKPKLTREEKDKQKQLKESFENLMNYDESVARKIRK